jgi:hypothetical protein
MSSTEKENNNEDERPAKRPALMSPLLSPSPSSSFPVQWSKEEAMRLSDGVITLKRHDLACSKTTSYYIHNVVFLTGRHTSSDLVNENRHCDPLCVSLSDDEQEGFAILLDFIYYSNSVEDDQRVIAKLTTPQALTVYHLADRFHAGSIQQALVDHLFNVHEFKASAQSLPSFPAAFLVDQPVSLAEAAHIAPTVFLAALPLSCRDNNRSIFRPSGHLRPLIALASMEGHADTLSEEEFHALWNLVYDGYPLLDRSMAIRFYSLEAKWSLQATERSEFHKSCFCWEQDDLVSLAVMDDMTAVFGRWPPIVLAHILSIAVQQM